MSIQNVHTFLGHSVLTTCLFPMKQYLLACEVQNNAEIGGEPPTPLCNTEQGMFTVQLGHGNACFDVDKGGCVLT
jgi:hypothetical protein